MEYIFGFELSFDIDEKCTIKNISSVLSCPLVLSEAFRVNLWFFGLDFQLIEFVRVL